MFDNASLRRAQHRTTAGDHSSSRDFGNDAGVGTKPSACCRPTLARPSQVFEEVAKSEQPDNHLRAEQTIPGVTRGDKSRKERKRSRRKPAPRRGRSYHPLRGLRKEVNIPDTNSPDRNASASCAGRHAYQPFVFFSDLNETPNRIATLRMRSGVRSMIRAASSNDVRLGEFDNATIMCKRPRLADHR
jgi:hypothetical protein